MDRNYPDIGIQIPQLFLPEPKSDLNRWSVVACDQFTSQEEYWRRVDGFIGNKPSTLRMILPEVYLGSAREKELILAAQKTMQVYLETGILQPREGMVYVERRMGKQTRRGLVLALDLENYDFKAGSTSLIRASEETILERIPPRLKIRENATLETAHILVLIDDENHSVIEPLHEKTALLTRIYDFELMENGGQIKGWLVDDQNIEKQVVSSLRQLLNPERLENRYGKSLVANPILFTVGDGNHSLATAKTYWEKIKHTVAADHPARWAMVEVINIQDDEMVFEPIHRVVFNGGQNLLNDLIQSGFRDCRFTLMQDTGKVKAIVKNPPPGKIAAGYFSADINGLVEFPSQGRFLVVAALQEFLDEWLKDHPSFSIDYIHGEEALEKLVNQGLNCGFFLPPLEKNALIPTILQNGRLPRKAFSIGEANEKRYYLESRKIR